jgi:hypothetical protein
MFQNGNVEFSNEKLIIAGEYYHHYEYSKQIAYGFEVPEKQKNFSTRAKDLSKRHDSNIWRSKKAIKLLLQANTSEQSFRTDSVQRPLFITLTFAENVQEVAEANYLFTKFVQKLNYNTFGEKKSILKYLAVIEFQQRGAIHYHVVFFNPLDISKFYDLVHTSWTHGFCHLKKIYNQTHLINYVHKDLTKLRQKKELFGHKSYFCSKGLLQSTQYRNKQKIQTLLPQQSKKQFVKIYNTTEMQIKYTQYKI